MKKHEIILILLLIPAYLLSQDTLSLQYCLESAIQHHPRNADEEIIREIGKKKLLNYRNNWYPTFDLSGQISYQSDVITIGENISIPNIEFPEPPQDQYKINLELNQTLYDGGRTKLLRSIEEANMQTELKQLESDLYQRKSLIKDLYFNILILQKNIKILGIQEDQLLNTLKILSAGREEGTVLSSDVDLIHVERLKLQQEISGLKSQRQAVLDVMEMETGIALDSQSFFKSTNFGDTQSEGFNRPEIQMLNEKKEVLTKSAELISRQRYPRAFAFGQLGYGNPGLNMLNDEFESYYYIGAGLKWNIWDWNQTNREKQIIGLQKELIDHQKMGLIRELNEGQIRYQASIALKKENIEKYQEMLSLRETITSSFKSRLNEGTIRTIDFLEVLNDEKITRIKLSTEQILLQKAIADHVFISGDL